MACLLYTSPDFGIVAGVGDLGADFDRIALPHHPSADKNRGSEAGADGLNVYVFAFVAKDGVAGADFQLGNVGEFADEGFGDAIAEIVGIQVSIHVGEGEHSYGIGGKIEILGPVSYTHLDVYKRQPQHAVLRSLSLKDKGYEELDLTDCYCPIFAAFCRYSFGTGHSDRREVLHHNRLVVVILEDERRGKWWLGAGSLVRRNAPNKPKQFRVGMRRPR